MQVTLAGLAGAAAALFAVLMVAQRSLYASAVCLLAVLLNASALLYITGTPLLAFLQAMIYAGGVMVLIVASIAVASPERRTSSRWGRLSLPWPVALAGLLLPAAEVGWLAWRGPLARAAPAAPWGAEARLGAAAFGTYAPATEAVTVLLILAGLGLLGARRAQR